MDILQLKARIGKWEDIHTEFKEWPVNNVSCAQSLVAFANTDGGQFVIGVAQDRRIIGVDNPDRVMQWVDNIAYNNCEPPITVVQETVRSEDGATVVVVNIPKGDQRPYHTSQGQCYIRTTSGKRLASQQELRRLFQASETLFYDETLVLRASLLDIDTNHFNQFLKRVYQQTLAEFPIGFEQLVRNLGLAKEQGGVLYPTVAGILFFGREPQRFLPLARVTVARIPGTDLSNAPSDAKQIDGDLLDMFEDTVRFLNIHLQTRHQISGFEPERFPELPEEAVREVVVNALTHRDYTVASPVRVFVFDDRMEVHTPGGLPNTVIIEAMKLGTAHLQRNPSIYALFLRWGLVTGVGTGVMRAIEAVRSATGREPDLSVIGNEFIVSFPRVRDDD